MKLFHRKIGEGQALIILHGLYGSSDNWLSIARQLSEFSCFLPDQRNHGRSPHMPTNTYEDMVADLLGFVTENKLNKVILMGHSMGGKVAMLFALKYPEFVDKLIVIDIAPKNYKNASNFGIETSNHQFILNTLSGLKPEQFSNRKELDKALSSKLKDGNLRSFLLKNIKRDANGSLKWRLNLNVLNESIDQILDGFSDIKEGSNLDALFVKGEHSPYIQGDDIFFVNNLFPKNQLVTIPDSGHWVHAEQPKLLVNTIRYFLL